MPTITLQARSSSGGSYGVRFTNSDGGLTIYCTCQAGQSAMLCKHLRGLALGDVKLLYQPSQKSDLEEVRRWCRAADVDELFYQLDIELKRLELAKKDLDQKASEVKSRLLEHTRRGLYVRADPTPPPAG
jgi:uncharacterized Zn finger protein